MNNKFDELTKGLAQTTTRRQALKKLGIGLAGMAIACFGLADRANGAKTCLPNGSHCGSNKDCCSGLCAKGRNPGNFGGGHYAFCY
jgi:hypothetical protein